MLFRTRPANDNLYYIKLYQVHLTTGLFIVIDVHHNVIDVVERFMFRVIFQISDWRRY